MATKVRAAEITMRENIPCCVIGGDTPAKLYDLLDGADIGHAVCRARGRIRKEKDHDRTGTNG